MHRLLAVCFVVGLVLPALSVPAGAADTGACAGTVERPAQKTTLVTTRGFRPVGDGFEKRPAFLVAFDGEARPVRSRDLADRGRFAGRSVAVTDAGTLLVSREGTHSVVEVLDEEFRPVRAVRFGVDGGPRADLAANDAILEPSGLLVAADDRLVRYDLDAERVTQEWPLPDDAFPDPESRVTAVAPADDGYLVTVAGNGTGSLLAVRDHGEVAWRVDGLREPVDVQSLGATALVAETAGDRVLELDRSGEVVWTLTGLHRPQSAQRLPGGRTLVADAETHRVLTVTPRGRVVWTAYAPWEPADATRSFGDEPPSAADLGVDGRHAVGGANATYTRLAACEAGFAALDENRSERARTVADDGAPIGLVGALAVGAVVLALAARRRL